MFGGLRRVVLTWLGATGALFSGCAPASHVPKSLVHWGATMGSFPDVSGMAADERGNLWIAEATSNRLLRIDSRGRVTVVAAGKISDPHQLAVDPKGRLLVADTGHNRIEMIDSSGQLNVIAGTGAAGNSGDGGPAVGAQLNHPQGVAVAQNGDIFIADTGNNRIREITANGHIMALAGSTQAGASGDATPSFSCHRAPEIRFDHPTELDADSPPTQGLYGETVYVLDTGNNEIRWLRWYGDTSLPPPSPAISCPQVLPFRPTTGIARLQTPIHMTTADGIGVLASGNEGHDLVVLSPSVVQPTYNALPSSRFTPDLSQVTAPGALAANQHLDFFVIDTATGRLHHARYQPPPTA